MKRKLNMIALAGVAAAAMVLIMTSCTPGQITQNAEYIAGAQFTTVSLTNHPDVAPAYLDEFANIDATKFVSGTLDPVEYGRLGGMFEKMLAQASSAKPANSNVYRRIISLINAGISTQGTSGGTINPYAGPLIAGVVNFQVGIKFSRQYNAGRAQITDPPGLVVNPAAKHL